MNHNKIKHLNIKENPLITTQNDIDNYNFLLKFIQRYPCAYSKMLRKRNELKKYFDWINQKTPKLNDQFYALSTKLYWIFNGLEDFPNCYHCGKVFDDRNVGIAFGYPRFCSIKCIANNPMIRKRKETTCEKKYGKGVINPSQAQCIKDKKEQTSLKHYGVTNPNKVPSVRRKIEATCITKYGAKSPLESIKIKEKIAQTNIKNLGVANPFELSSVAHKGLQGRLKKYAVLWEKCRLINTTI